MVKSARLSIRDQKTRQGLTRLVERRGRAKIIIPAFSMHCNLFIHLFSVAMHIYLCYLSNAEVG